MTPPWRSAAEPPPAEGPYIGAYSLTNPSLAQDGIGQRYVREVEFYEGRWCFPAETDSEGFETFLPLAHSGLTLKAWQPLPDWPADA